MTNYHKLSDLKQHLFIISQFLLPGCNQLLARTAVPSEVWPRKYLLPSCYWQDLSPYSSRLWFHFFLLTVSSGLLSASWFSPSTLLQLAASLKPVKEWELWPHGLKPIGLLCSWNSWNWNGLPCPSLEDLPNPGIKPRSPAWQAESLPLSHLGSP